MAEKKFIKYNERSNCEKYESDHVQANDLFNNIKNNLKSESQYFAGFITVKDYSRKMQHRA